MDGHKSGGLLQGDISEFPGGDTGGGYVPHHIQCGGRCRGLALGQRDGRDLRWAWTGGQTPKCPFL